MECTDLILAVACVGSSFDTQIAPFEPSASFDFKVDSSAKSRPAGGGGGGGRRSSKGNERPADTASATESSADSGVGIRTRSMAKQGSTSSGCGCSSSRSSKSKKKEAQTSASGGDDSTEESLDSLYGDISGGKVREYKEAFAMLDENCDGLISAGEIKSMFGRIGQPVTDEEVTAMLREIDLDGNQYIDFDEFMQMMLKYESRITPEQYEMSLRRVFEIFDLDKNSFITQTELKQVMAKLGEELSDDEVADMIRVADEDGDGRINFNEFRTIMEFVKTGKMGQIAAAGSGSASASGSKDAKQRKKK